MAEENGTPFRKSALEYVTAPLALDEMIQITPPSAWILLLACWLILFTVVAWLFFGSIETRVQGQGILWGKNEKIISVTYAENNSYVKEVNTHTGALVNRGDILADLYNPNLENEIATTQTFLEDLQRQQAQGDFLTTHLSQLQREINVEKRRLFTLLNRKKLATTLISPVTGMVVSVQVQLGDYLERGSAAFQIVTPSQGLMVILYVPATQAKRVAVGMPVQITPSIVNELEYRKLSGKVIAIDALPSTPESLTAVLKNPSLVNEFLHNGPITTVHVQLLRNNRNGSGYQWTSSHVPNYALTSGTLVQAQIITQRQTPLSLIFPFFNKRP